MTYQYLLMNNNHKLSPVIKFCLFLVSYFPLFVIMGILHYDNMIILYPIIFVAIFGFAGLIITFYVFNHISGTYEEASEIKAVGKINFEYFLAYIIPFVTIDIDSTRQLLAYLVLLTFICILYLRTGLFYVNPMLTILGYNLFKIRIRNNEALLIAKSDQDNVLKNQIIHIDRNLYFEPRHIKD